MTCDLSGVEMKVVKLRFFWLVHFSSLFFWDGIMFACERLRLQILPLAKKKKKKGLNRSFLEPEASAVVTSLEWKKGFLPAHPLQMLPHC